MKIKESLIKKIGQQIGEEYYGDIVNAFDASMIDRKFKNMVDQKEVDLVDYNNQKLLANAMNSS